MSTDKERLDETKDRIREMRRDLSHGVANPENAAQHACMALLVMVDLMDYLITEIEADQED